MEHVPRPIKVLKIWIDLLKEGGYLYLFLPSMDIIYDEYRAFEKFHYSFFTIRTFTKMVEKLGLQVLDVQLCDKDNRAGSGSMKFILKKVNLK